MSLTALRRAVDMVSQFSSEANDDSTRNPSACTPSGSRGESKSTASAGISSLALDSPSSSERCGWTVAMARDKVKRNVVELCGVPTGREGRPS